MTAVGSKDCGKQGMHARLGLIPVRPTGVAPYPGNVLVGAKERGSNGKTGLLCCTQVLCFTNGSSYSGQLCEYLSIHTEK
jgi:hypothetical protein